MTLALPDPSLPRTRRRQLPKLARFALRELGIWALLYAVYLGIRDLAIGSADEAFAHADAIVELERRLGIFTESTLQTAVDAAGGLFGAYYMLGFGPLTGAVVIWLALRHRPHYRTLRTLLLGSLAIAAIGYVLYPTAPPRLVPGLGIDDVVGLSSHDTGSFLGIRFNPYAAVPSMHLGWALVVGIAGFRATRRRWLKASSPCTPS